MKHRNILSIFCIAVLLCAAVATLSACGGGAPADTSLTGRYLIVDISDDPDGTTFNGLDAMYKAENERITDYIYFEFLSGERFTLVLFGEEEAGGTYTRDGNSLSFMVGAESFAAILDGDKLTYPYEAGAKLIFQKEKEATLPVGGLPTNALVAIIAGAVALFPIVIIIVLAVIAAKRKKTNHE
ncbi:MAG: hypothetical protein FWD58_10165 [Firmicutes bacterium]|nr:hypothetical protein [Bacillota bacterium]